MGADDRSPLNTPLPATVGTAQSILYVQVAGFLLLFAWLLTRVPAASLVVLFALVPWTALLNISVMVGRLRWRTGALISQIVVVLLALGVIAVLPGVSFTPLALVPALAPLVVIALLLAPEARSAFLHAEMYRADQAAVLRRERRFLD